MVADGATHGYNLTEAVFFEGGIKAHGFVIFTLLVVDITSITILTDGRVSLLVTGGIVTRFIVAIMVLQNVSETNRVVRRLLTGSLIAVSCIVPLS